MVINFSNILAKITATNIDPSIILTLFIYTGVIAAYGLLIFYFYKFIANKNIFELNLSQYHKGFGEKIKMAIKSFLNLIEYIIVLPFITFFWFTILSVFLLILAKDLPIENVLLVSAALVTSVRITSYINKNLSQDLAKMLPLTLLGIALTTQNFFNLNLLLIHIKSIPTLLSEIFYFVGFIILIEIIMRFLDIFTNLFKPKKKNKENENEE